MAEPEPSYSRRDLFRKLRPDWLLRRLFRRRRDATGRGGPARRANDTAAAGRPWQFSLRAVLVVTLVVSVALSLLKCVGTWLLPFMLGIAGAAAEVRLRARYGGVRGFCGLSGGIVGALVGLVIHFAIHPPFWPSGPPLEAPILVGAMCAVIVRVARRAVLAAYPPKA